MRTSWALAALIALAPAPAHAECKGKQIEVKGKTPIRRGPGLNYAVSAFLNNAECMKLQQVSTDEQWVLVEDPEKKLLGWVPASAVDGSDRERLAGGAQKTGPVGSGQERGFVVAKAAIALLPAPSADAQPRKTLPAGSKLLALAMTEDQAWVEVRDERGDTGWVGARGLEDSTGALAQVPRSGAGLQTGMKTPEPPVKTAAREEPAKGGRSPKTGRSPGGESAAKSGGGKAPGDVPKTNLTPGPGTVTEGPIVETPVTPAPAMTMEAVVAGLASLPLHRLTSNGMAGYRRYQLTALAAGAHVGVRLPLDVVRARLDYNFMMMSGIASDGMPDAKLGAQQHDARLLVGYPLDLDMLSLTPEVGYAFALFAMPPSIPGDNVIRFVSNHTHGVHVGVDAALHLMPGFDLLADGGIMLGTSLDYALDVGGGGLSFGYRAGAGAQVELGEGAFILARYEFSGRSAPHSGPSADDPTITEATILHLEHGLQAGMAFRF